MKANHVGVMLLIDEIADCIERTGCICDYIGVRSHEILSSHSTISDMLIASYSILEYGSDGRRIAIEVMFLDFCVDGYSLAGMTLPIIKEYLNQEVDKQMAMSYMQMAVYQQRFAKGGVD